MNIDTTATILQLSPASATYAGVGASCIGIDTSSAVPQNDRSSSSQSSQGASSFDQIFAKMRDSHSNSQTSADSAVNGSDETTTDSTSQSHADRKDAVEKQSAKRHSDDDEGADSAAVPASLNAMSAPVPATPTKAVVPATATATASADVSAVKSPVNPVPVLPKADSTDKSTAVVPVPSTDDALTPSNHAAKPGVIIPKELLDQIAKKQTVPVPTLPEQQRGGKGVRMNANNPVKDADAAVVANNAAKSDVAMSPIVALPTGTLPQPAPIVTDPVAPASATFAIAAAVPVVQDQKPMMDSSQQQLPLENSQKTTVAAASNPPLPPQFDNMTTNVVAQTRQAVEPSPGVIGLPQVQNSLTKSTIDIVNVRQSKAIAQYSWGLVNVADTTTTADIVPLNAVSGPAESKDADTSKAGPDNSVVMQSDATSTTSTFVVPSSDRQTSSSVPVPVHALAQHVEDIVSQRLDKPDSAGPSSVVLRLDPPELGRVNVHVSLNNDVVSIRMVTSDEGARQMIERQLNDLQQSLSHQGVTVDQCQVECNSNGSGQQAFDQGMRQQTSDDSTPLPFGNRRGSQFATTSGSSRTGARTQLDYVA